MKKRILHTSLGVVAGIAILVGTIWVLGKALTNVPYRQMYAGNSLDYWREQLHSGDAGASNAAFAVVSAQVIPKLVDRMFNDTNDSSLRLSLIKALNGLPGVQIAYWVAHGRRSGAAGDLGSLGPVAQSCVPDLIRALKSNDIGVKAAVIGSLGKIRSDPETVIPALIPYLDDENFNVEAAGALSEFGSLAKPAVPKLLRLLKSKDDDDQVAGRDALLKIDPDAAAKAGLMAKIAKTRK